MKNKHHFLKIGANFELSGQMNFGADCGTKYSRKQFTLSQEPSISTRGIVFSKNSAREQFVPIGFVDQMGVLSFIPMRDTIALNEVLVLYAFSKGGDLYPFAEFSCELFEDNPNEVCLVQIGGEYLGVYSMKGSENTGIEPRMFSTHGYERAAKQAQTKRLFSNDDINQEFIASVRKMKIAHSNDFQQGFSGESCTACAHEQPRHKEYTSGGDDIYCV